MKIAMPSLIPSLAVTVGVFAYLAFVAALFSSSGSDRTAGGLMLVNVPVTLMWLLAQWTANRHATTAGVIAAAMQAVIAAVMIVAEIGDVELVCVINSGIVFAILLLVWLGQNYPRWSLARSFLAR
ncbi:MAG: hypothetical protein R3C10_22025 [Pirellulales bacterium]